jgi:uncharacterized protein (DUF608 family)
MHPSFQIPIKKSVTATLFFYLFMLFALAQAQTEKIDGTTGAPLGGVGCGAIKFCSHAGTFAGTWRTPCALDDFTALPNTQFQFFSQVGTGSPVTSAKLSAVITGGRADDDAVYPVQTANFGTINNISVTLTAFSPWDLANIDLMCYPYAFFQIALTNNNSSDAVAAVALQASLTTATAFVAGKGMKNDDGALKRAIYVTSDEPAVVVSAGSDNGFMTSGQCNNTVAGTAVNKVAAKVTIPAGQTKLVKFVYAWNNNVTGFEGNHDGMFYYLNKFTEAGATADSGLAHFDGFRDNAVTFITRMRASNLPGWLKNETVSSLANLTSNSMYRKDGRFAHTYGQWATNGTNDQMFHSRQIFAAVVPSLNWNELHYWARTQKTNPVGQIHHDIDSCSDDENFTMSRNMAYMCPWDAQQHHDYRNIDLWVDLNCVFILSVYEAFIATADTAELSFLWPYTKLAGQRVIQQLTDNNRGSSDGYPYLFSQNTQNTYDADGTSDMSAYNNSLAMTTFKSLAIMSTIKGESASVTQFTKYYDSIRTEFPKYYFTAAHFPAIRAENVMTGQWLNYFLKFGELMDSTKQVYALTQLNNLYNPTTGFQSATKTYSEWSEYLVSHLGGLCLQTGRYAEWQGLQYDWYQRIFNNRDLVYDIELGIPDKVVTPKYLATNLSCFNHYISVPVVWRNYYTIVGFQRNKYTQELWLEPCLPPTLTTPNHVLTDALVFSAEGPATVSYKETGTTYKVQDILFKPDNPIDVSSLYVKDKELAANYIKISGVLVDNAKITKVGTGFAKKLKISYNGTIPASGITITVSDDQNFSSSFAPVRFDMSRAAPGARAIFSSTPNSFSIATPPSYAYTIQICDLNGKIIRQLRGNGTANVRFHSSTRRAEKSLSPGIYAVRVSIGNNIFSKCFILSE